MKILLASDGSSDSLAAARFVRNLAGENELDVHVVTVSYTPMMNESTAHQPWSEEWNQYEEKRVKTLHAELMTMLSEACSSLTMNQRYGHVAHTLLEEAKLLDPDLIVLGARGHSAVARMLLGSVSDTVATQAECSVVVVRPDSATEGPMQMVLGYDQSKSSREAVSELMLVHWPKETGINVVSIASAPFPFEEDSIVGSDRSWESELTEQTRCAAESIAGEIASHVPRTTTQVLQAGHIGDAIVREAEKEDADIIVVGDSGHGMLEDLLLGSTTKYVLRHGTCTVWISRHHRRVEQPSESSDQEESAA